MVSWEDSDRGYLASGRTSEPDDPQDESEHQFSDRTDEWRRVRDTAYAGVPGQDEGIEGPGPYYPEYQISGEVIHPRRSYHYPQFEPGAVPPQPEWEWAEWPGFQRHRGWSEAHRVSWRRPARRWSEEYAPPGWHRISRGRSVGRPPEAWTRPGSIPVTTGGAGGHYGRGPKGYVRSDERIREDVCDLFMSTRWLDCSDIEISVDKGEVTLNGTVDSRRAKRDAEEIAADVLGVKDVHNRLRIAPQQAAR